ncbi:GerMN domain-containing protein [Salipaludibacillus sp. CUR1]|uniref:GerMN domain-containing protein n=1 Tax=Salipaludibacillus sp. CUR1 TaxID=2820003 RepID=UPI001E54ADD5|nr:GerMN domain-containing protein [Salipaludibacillus sp. CUR1]MCE7793438.1 GerMN domain-containing protein [Salipaludibacillus sp. CUR1]
MLRGWKMKGAAAIGFGAIVVLFSACGSETTDDVLEEIDPPQIDYIEDEDELEVEVIETLDEGQISSITDDPDANEELDEFEWAEENEEMAEEKGGPVMEDEDIAEEKGGPVTDDEDMTEEKDGLAAAEEDIHEVYLVDRNGMVAPQSMSLILGDNEVKNLVESLVQEGPVTELLPNGFQAVLPAGTEVLDTKRSKDGTVTVDFNDSFSDYHPSQEMQVLQSLTWTLTELEGIDRVQLKMNGEDLDAMPQNNTPLGQGYTRDHGINLEMNDQADLTATDSVIVYFLSQTEDETYYVPVTRRISQNEDKYEAIVNELLEGPDYMSRLLTDFRQEAELLEKPDYADGTVTLNFNEALLSQLEGTAVSENVLNMIVLSLTEQEGVERVSLKVDSEQEILVSNGQSVSEPIVRPERVNTGRF